MVDLVCRWHGLRLAAFHKHLRRICDYSTLCYCASFIVSSDFQVTIETSANKTTSNLYMRITPESGARLHKVLLQSVMGAPQSFFDETDSGVTLNRFSQDMTIIDGQLPISAVLSFSCEPLSYLT